MADRRLSSLHLIGVWSCWEDKLQQGSLYCQKTCRRYGATIVVKSIIVEWILYTYKNKTMTFFPYYFRPKWHGFTATVEFIELSHISFYYLLDFHIQFTLRADAFCYSVMVLSPAHWSKVTQPTTLDSDQLTKKKKVLINSAVLVNGEVCVVLRKKSRRFIVNPRLCNLSLNTNKYIYIWTWNVNKYFV